MSKLFATAGHDIMSLIRDSVICILDRQIKKTVRQQIYINFLSSFSTQLGNQKNNFRQLVT